jgi:hypothetical protein
MKKTILAIGVIVLTMATVQAQDKTSKKKTISIAANVGIPTTTGLSFAYGGDLQAGFGVSTGLDITVSGGYEAYSVKGGGHTSGLIPLLAGAKFNLGSDKVYGHAQLGYGISTVSGGGGAFAYAPSIGYQFSQNFDGSIKYLAFSKNGFTTGSINLRIAYDF